MSNSDESKPIIPVLTGPTGSGKSAVIDRLLEEIPDLHIISADSRQIYKHLNIGTDKPTPSQLRMYNYYMVDLVMPGERYTAFDFVEKTKALIQTLFSANHLPIICGGTGLYIKSLVEGIVDLPEDDLTIRRDLENEAISRGPKYLYEKLQEVDPVEASQIHPNNIRKVIRALEICYLTGRPKSKILAEGKSEPSNRYDIVCLIPPREKLYENINLRVDRMMKDGLLGEVESLHNMGLAERIRRINVIGYNELLRYIDDQISLSTAVNLIKQNSRRFAKRQITWFRGMNYVKILDSLDSAHQYLRKFWQPKIKT